ncbi:hypothetical protein CRG98_034303 [Punica granatum]|uniref:Uncharacterized protein n=1 Tax=Punica granatum TaxID=22663 RepID=A0A2I0INL9_PUNGR|nr:hypothetical protein CRG98_034303 [Punica granatum]
MARLAKVANGNGMSRGPTRTRGGLRAMFLCNSESLGWKLQTQKLSSEMDLGERFTCRPRLEIDIQRRPKNPRTGLSRCFPSVLMCSETTVISVRQKRVPKVCREVFGTTETSLGRSGAGGPKWGAYTRGLGSRRESTITVYPVPLDSGDSTALDLRVVNSKWRLLLMCVRRASPGKWILPSRVA